MESFFSLDYKEQVFPEENEDGLSDVQSFSFVLYSKDSLQNFKSTGYTASSRTAEVEMTEAPEPPPKYTADWILISGLAALVLLIILRQARSGLVSKIFPSAISYSQAQNLHTEQKKNPSMVFFFMGIISLSMLSIFIYQVIYFYYDGLSIHKYFYVVAIAGVLLVLRLLHRVISFMGSQIFRISTLSKEYQFNIAIFNGVTGIVFIPIVLSVAFSDYPEAMIYAGLASLSVLFPLRYLRIFQINFRNKHNFFYLFLYLCSLEIIPFLIGIRLFNNLIIN